MKLSFPIIIVSGFLLLSSNGFADVLLLEGIQNSPVNSEEGIPRPTNGMTMDQVKSQYGEPSVVHPWVGDPPITRWDYPEYSVFFEYQRVLTSVLQK